MNATTVYKILRPLIDELRTLIAGIPAVTSLYPTSVVEAPLVATVDQENLLVVATVPGVSVVASNAVIEVEQFSVKNLGTAVATPVSNDFGVQMENPNALGTYAASVDVNGLGSCVTWRFDGTAYEVVAMTSPYP
jgi:hypothetical protein